MARLVDNYCVGCGLPCIHCSREKDVVHHSCDSCGADDIDGETTIYIDDDDSEYCWECLLRKHIMEFATDMAEEYGREWIGRNFDEVWSEKR